MPVTVKCHICAKPKDIVPAKYKKIMQGTGLFFCSRAHYWEWRRGEGRDHFSKVFKDLAASGNTKAANQASTGKPSWNKGKTAATSPPMARARDARLAHYGGSEGLAEHARALMIEHQHGFYTGPRRGLPAQQLAVLEMVEDIVGDKATYEHFALIGNPPKPIFIDIAVASRGLAIEVDGKEHRTKAGRKRDAYRDHCLGKLGWKVLRFNNDTVDASPEAVLRAIKKALR